MLRRTCELNKMRNNQYHDENQYLQLLEDILTYGEKVNGRNGCAITVHGGAMHFSLENGIIPLLTTKKLAYKTCLKELLWFISGSTDNEELQKINVKIWNDNASREFLDERGLTHYAVNDLGPVYGHQWRHFNAKYESCHDDYNNKGVDQLRMVIDMLKDPVERFSRRIIMSAWNPCQLAEMALPPCHVLVQFHVLPPNKLSCSLYQRSGDVGLGVPFNIASYAYLTHLLAHHCGLVAHEFLYHLGNCHIYDDHAAVLQEQLERSPLMFPTLKILNKYDSIEKYLAEDFVVENYQHLGQITMNMRP